MSFPRMARFRDVASLRSHLADIVAPIPLDDAPLSAAEGSPLAEAVALGGRTAGNRLAIHPMEGWDATDDGRPSDTLLRRWRNFGMSGAKLIWGGEAVAVVPEGRANPNQLTAPACGREGFATLLAAVKDSHRESFGHCDDLVVALQLTHSGRFSKPTRAGRAPRIAFHHPVLDARHGVDPDDRAVVLGDDEVEALIGRYVQAAIDAHAAGFDMVDIKSCHGYLLHEFLAARRRPGRFGGDLAGRSRPLFTIIERVREACPTLVLGVRLSLFDTVPWQKVGDQGAACPVGDSLPYDAGFGVDMNDPARMDLTEPLMLLAALRDRGVAAVNLSAGCPYANPHILRPAAFPPSDGYPPPEDPLLGVWRQIDAARQAKQAVPGLALVGSGYTYLQEYVPHAAQAAVRQGWIDVVGLGRMVLSYPELPADLLAGRSLARGRICRTFSDCTTAPRNGLRSGCYPLDAFYKSLEPEASQMKAIKAEAG
jgi:NADPH2 dehydrogenase